MKKHNSASHFSRVIRYKTFTNAKLWPHQASLGLQQCLLRLANLKVLGCLSIGETMTCNESPLEYDLWFKPAGPILAQVGGLSTVINAFYPLVSREKVHKANICDDIGSVGCRPIS